MTIKLIEDKEIWDRFVDQSSYGLLFHKWDFLKIMEKHTGYKLLSYGIYNGHALICIFPLFFKKFKGIKAVFSPPVTAGMACLGPVMDKEFDILKQNKKETYLNIVVEGLNEEIKKISPNYVRISLVQNFLDIRPFQWSNYSADAYFTYVFDLNLSLDQILNGFRKDLRNGIKQVDASNFKLLSSNDISMFCELEKEKYRKKGLDIAILSSDYIEDLFDAYPENLKLSFLYDGDNDIISAQVSCEYKDRYTLWLGGEKSHKYIYGNEYRVWECIKQAKNAGYKKLDWGGGPKNISRFKSKFDPTLEMYFVVHKKDNIGKFAEWSYMNFANMIYNL